MLFDIPRSGDGQEEPWLPSIDAMVRVNAKTNFLCIVASIMPEGIAPWLRKKLLENGVAPLMGMSEFLAALGSANCYREKRQVILAEGEPPPPLLSVAVLKNETMRNEWESKQALAEYSLPMPKRWVGCVDDAVAAALRIGFPVVLKVLSDQLAHKAKVGGVVPNLHGENDVTDALIKIKANLATSNVQLEKVLIEKMVVDSMHELIIGIKRHPQLGLGLLIGRGGVKVESQQVYMLVLLPSTPTSFNEALSVIDPGLTQPARDNVLSTMHLVARFAIDNADSLVELDINPIIVSSDGTVTAVDALTVIGEHE
jgi:acyl-CoA synthetase (NDP forming)